MTRNRLIPLILLLIVALASALGCDNKPITKDVVLEENVPVPESLQAATEEPAVPQGPAFKHLDAASFNEMIQQQGVQILNVLEPGETYPALAALPQKKIVSIPLQQVLDGTFTGLDRTKKIVVICRTGSRSAQAAEFLGQNAFDAYSLDGGLLGLDGAPATDDASGSAVPPAETDAGEVDEAIPAAPADTDNAPAAPAAPQQ